MDKISVITGVAVPLQRANVDTDQIIPAEFLKRVTKTGYDDALIYTSDGGGDRVYYSARRLLGGQLKDLFGGEAMSKLLEELKARGTPLYAITNFNQDKFRETVARFPFLRLFRVIVVSGDERVVKPDPAIYRLLMERNGLAAEACVFIDDSLNNVAGAKAVGMKAIHFTGPEALRTELAGLELL